MITIMYLQFPDNLLILLNFFWYVIMYADASFGPMIELGPVDQTKDVKVRSGKRKEKITHTYKYLR